jgi:hypothetical protein
MLADELDYVVGVDTHLDEHVLAAVAAPAGRGRCERGCAGKRPRLSGGAWLRGFTEGGGVFSEYNYLRGRVFLRVSHELTPQQAKRYEAVLSQLDG